jgi:hypothetical protein
MAGFHLADRPLALRKLASVLRAALWRSTGIEPWEAKSCSLQPELNSANNHRAECGSRSHTTPLLMAPIGSLITPHEN